MRISTERCLLRVSTEKQYVMKILVIADTESKSLWDYFSPGKLDGIDLIISCGDLDAAYLEFLVTMGNAPVWYVPGNHDTKYIQKPPEGCECLDGGILVHQGIRFLGFGGSMRYGNGRFMYSEQEMSRRLHRARREIVSFGGFDVLVTHAPAQGYGDLDDLPHMGFDCFNRLLNAVQPRYMLHGHVHANYGSGFQRETLHPSGTRIINAYEKYLLTFDEQKSGRFYPSKELRQRLRDAAI